MKRPILLIGFLSLASCFPLQPAPAQTADPLPSTPNLVFKHDRFRKTSVWEPKKFLKLGNGLELKVYSMALDSAPNRVFPPRWMFIYDGKNWRYLYSHPLIFLIDGESVPIDSVDRDGRVVAGGVLEFLTPEVPLETFRKIANAKVVEGRLGTTEFVLSPEQRQVMRELLLLVEAGTKRQEEGKSGPAQ